MNDVKLIRKRISLWHLTEFTHLQLLDQFSRVPETFKGLVEHKVCGLRALQPVILQSQVLIMLVLILFYLIYYNYNVYINLGLIILNACHNSFSVQ